MKKFLKTILCLILALAALAGGFILWLTVREYKPADVEDLPVQFAPTSNDFPVPAELDILTWNIGYGGLGAESDFFMDGGTQSRPADKAVVEQYIAGISQQLSSLAPDLIMLQEVDVDSSRTYGIDQSERLGLAVSVHALNYSCDFVPIPWPPIGKVHSGLMTTSPGNYRIDSAQRIALPCPFSWPVSAANLKRCLLVTYLPVERSEAQLVLVNLHLEAYDDGEGKIAQTNQLRSFIQSEYEKGNYVIAGGDFNQIFPGSLDVYPNTHEELWEPGVLDDSMLPEGWSLAYDLSTPTCRLLNQPYDPADTVNTQYYVIDGFILSPNVQLQSVETVDLGFANSDHNPVKISVKLN